jgi:hypothetical protein
MPTKKNKPNQKPKPKAKNQVPSKATGKGTLRDTVEKVKAAKLKKLKALQDL